jgi:hypothetical protein
MLAEREDNNRLSIRKLLKKQIKKMRKRDHPGTAMMRVIGFTKKERGRY